MKLHDMDLYRTKVEKVGPARDGLGVVGFSSFKFQVRNHVSPLSGPESWDYFEPKEYLLPKEFME